MTTPSLVNLYIPKGKSIYRGGWDGKIEASATTPFIPEGISLWEFGTEKNPAGKAESDYRKRTDSDQEGDVSNATFVFVTTRVWEKNEDWITEKKAEGKWRDIRVIDGNMMVEWLSASAIVSQQLAGFIGVKITGSLESVEQFWENWSIGPKQQQLSPKLLLAGRKSEAVALTEQLQQPPAVIPVQASTREEALSFCAAVILSNEEYRERLLACTVITDNEDDFKLILHEPPSVIIPRFSSNSIIYTAITKNHHIILLLGGDEKRESENKIVLPKLGREEILEGLTELGLTEDQARSLSKETGRNISVIRRRLGFTGTQPEWSLPAHYMELLPALLAGKWNEDKEGDRMIIANLSGMSYDAYTEKLKKWLVHNDPPIINAGSHWRVVSALDAWTYLGQYLSKAQLEALADSFLFACGDIKPSLSLEPAQRYMASFYGKVSDFSHHIREGLTQSLILIALYGENYQLQLPHTPQIWVDQLVSRLYSKQDEDLWKSLDDILPLVAEASPSSFLNALELFLKQAPEKLQQIFEEAGGFISPSYYHTGMLWALEGLAWLPHYLPKSCFALLKLNELDPGIKIQNRPINSIYEILNPWMPQTFGSSVERKEIIRTIILREPSAGWNLCLVLLPSHSMVGHPTFQLRWRQYHLEQPEILTDNIYADFLSFLAEQLLSLSGHNIERLTTLLGRFDDLGLTDKQNLIRHIKDNAAKIDDSSQNMWAAIREVLHNQHLDYREDWFLPEPDKKQLKTLYNLFTPRSVTDASLWVFNDNWPHFPDGFGKVKDNGTAQEAFIKKKRIEMLKTIYQNNSFEIFEELTTKVNEPWIFGSVASMIRLKKSEEVQFAELSFSGDPKKAAAGRGFISQIHFSEGLKAISTLYEKLKKKNHTEEQLTGFLLCARSEFDLWQLIEEQSRDIQELYWKKCEGNFWDKDIVHQEFEIERLMAAKRYYTILHICSHNVENHRTELLTKTLEKIATEHVTDTERLDHHHLTRLMDELYKRPDADQTRLARLEWNYLELLTRGFNRSRPKLLYQEMSSTPGFFIDILCFLYQPDDEEMMEKEMVGLEPEFMRQRAKKAYQLLDNWDVVPGTIQPPEGRLILDGEALKEWVSEARRLGSERARLPKADLFIGKILGKFPEGEEPWPPEPIAGIVDDINTNEIKDNFRVSVMNKRSSSSRSPYAGGQRERNLAAYFQRLADGRRLKYPVTASILESIAASWIIRGKAEDNDALVNDLD